MTKIKMMLALLAIALVIAMPALAQDTTQPSTPANPSMGQSPDQNSTQPAPPSPDNSQAVQSQSNQAAGSNTGTDSQLGQTLTGTISADGKTFNSNGTTYTISNPNSVKTYANQPITVGYEMDSNNSIRITKVMLTKPQQ
jgi:opacity protein-like surface antigen